MKFLILFALLAATHALPRSIGTPRIVGGSEAVPHSQKHQVILHWATSLGYAFYCSGSLIGPQKVLTAAQCLEGQTAFANSVKAGVHHYDKYNSTAGTAQSRGWLWSVKHPLYNETTLDYNYALIHLTLPFTLNEYVGTIALPEVGSEPSGTCLTSGWGYTDETDVLAQDLQQLDQPIVDRAVCQDLYSELGVEITERQICGGDMLSNGVCVGDQGGPLVCRDQNDLPYLAGITSDFRTPCGQTKYPNVYSNVASVLDWIKSH